MVLSKRFSGVADSYPDSNPDTKKYGQKSGKNRIFPIFDVFGPFWPVFDVLEARDPFKKLPGGDTLLFHRV